MIKYAFFLFFMVYSFICAQQHTENGFNGAQWGISPNEVKMAVNAQNWQQIPVTGFPKDMNIKIFSSKSIIASYPATVKYYFWNDLFFQATTSFDFNELENYDFNYNVYRSVNEYYSEIRSKTTVFVHEIYRLLESKYGKKKPVFKMLDPLKIFAKLDSYLRHERWNLRYHPYDFYQRIVTSAYARWDFPKSRVIFSVKISAPEKRFDFILSSASLEMKKSIENEIKRLKSRGL